VLTLEGLAFYWNSKTELFSKVEESVRLKRFHQEIATKNEQPKGYTYSKFFLILTFFFSVLLTFFTIV
jgi:hypothetical protein